jgi:hypothetical protein
MPPASDLDGNEIGFRWQASLTEDYLRRFGQPVIDDLLLPGEVAPAATRISRIEHVRVYQP